ncbi:MAG: nucleotidyltransferase domain-containing protein [bacterium]|nr:nucleotidyltransferase domain-containing protein [bacterium]
MKIEIVDMFKQKVLEILKSPKIKFILFGSRGRGNADEFSDYDILIITSQKESNIKEVKDKIEEIEMDMFLAHNAIINSHLFSEEEIKQLSFEPFIINALHEGVAA